METNIFVLAIPVRDVFKTFSRRPAKMSSRSFEDVSSGETVALGHTSAKCIASIENLQVCSQVLA